MSGLKKRNKANAEFNMSSMTDIIFLLLIFFMLTSSATNPNSKKVDRPKSNSTTPSPQNVSVAVLRDETNPGQKQYFINKDLIPEPQFEGLLADEISKEREILTQKGQDPETVTVVLSVASDETTGTIVKMIELSSKLGVRLILATDAPEINPKTNKE